MRPLRPLLTIFVLSLLAVAGCKHSPTAPDKTRTTTKFTCDAAGGGSVGCDITIPPNTSKLRITLVSHDCDARGNIISISEPKPVTLTTDACYETVPKTIEIAGPFSVTNLSMKVTSQYITNPPELKVVGTSSPWTVDFEDGGDRDFNDAVITITAL